MIVQQIKSGGDRNFSYLIGCSKKMTAVLIDPSPDPERCERAAIEGNFTLSHIINTHSHMDHTSGNSYFLNKNIPLITHPDGNGDIKVTHQDSLTIGSSVKLTFHHTPGHTHDSICIEAAGHLFTGDTLFVGKVGGTYSREDAILECESLAKLMQLPSQTIVWPGHDYGISPHSTIEKELQSNPFVQRLHNFDSFFWLKQNWAEYKMKHGIQ